MLKFLQHTMEIQISNTSQDITLENPRPYFYRDHNSTPLSPSMPPGSSDTFLFSSPPFWGCVGVLVYEATTFTLSICFFNLLDYNLYSMELGLELSLCKAHPGRLKDTYTRMSQREISSTTDVATVSHHVTVDTCQEPAQMSIGHIKVITTMSNDQSSVIRVVVGEQEGSGKKPRKETPNLWNHVQLL